MFKKIFKVFDILLILIVLAGLLTFFYPLRYTDKLRYYSDAYGMNMHYVMSVIKVESGFDEKALSNKGAVGLMQVTPETGAWIYQKLYNREAPELDLHDIDRNLEFGVWFLAFLRDYYYGDTVLMASAYNAGIGTVDGWLQDESVFKNGVDESKIPYAETREYVKKIKDNMKIYSALYPGIESGSNIWIAYMQFASAATLFIRNNLLRSGLLKDLINNILGVVRTFFG